MHRALPLLASIALLIAPAGVRAEDELPAPLAIECPAAVIVEGVARIPDDAPADCVYPGALPMPIAGDPCAPDTQGVVPEACLSAPADAVEPCWISSDGATNCPDESPAAEPEARSYELVSVSAGGAPIEVAGRLTLYDEPGRISATVGCNSVGGDARFGSGGSIELGELFVTEMYCPDLAEAESALLAVLAGDDLRLDGDRISSSAGTLSLRAADPVDETVAEPSGIPAGALIALLVGAGIVTLLALRPRSR